MAKKKQQVVVSPVTQAHSNGTSLIESELQRFSRQVDEIFAALESVNLLAIEDANDRLKATKEKLALELKMPILLTALDDLRNRDKLKSESIKGNKDISLLESGEI